jgi:tRNA-specific 2-thiouridylase
VGQRKGLRLAYPTPLFVVRVEAATDTVWVGGEDDLAGRELTARDTVWCGPAPTEPFQCQAKIRSRSPERPAWVRPGPQGQVDVTFQEPQRAIAPGQAVVFYDGDEVLGGGWIDRIG